MSHDMSYSCTTLVTHKHALNLLPQTPRFTDHPSFLGPDHHHGLNHG